VIHHIPVSAKAASEAREIVRTDSPPVLSPGKVADAQLVASELVEQVVLRVGPGSVQELAIEVMTGADRLKIVVEDIGSAFASDELRPSSRDDWDITRVRVLDAVASSWGTAPSASGGTIAWAEIDM
jgi:hypothetical protein